VRFVDNFLVEPGKAPSAGSKMCVGLSLSLALGMSNLYCCAPH